jgi:hypothetical protein
VTTLTAALEELKRQGFTEHFALVGGRLRGLGSRQTFRPDQVKISEFRRFEGISDPDDMSILYAIETEDGLRGTLVDAFGVHADPEVGAFVRELSRRRAPRSPGPS